MANWKSIQGFDGWEVSDEGQVRDCNGKIKSTSKGRYYIVCIEGHALLLHRLVCAAFHENPDNKPCVNHIDGDKHNNRADNLEWSTYQENNAHARKTGLNMVTEETRRKMSESQRGRHQSEETRKKISEANKGVLNPNYGKHLSEEHRRKLSEAHKGQPSKLKGCARPEEVRRKISEAHKGLKQSEVHRKHNSESKKGRIHITNGVEHKMIRPELFYLYEPQGFIRGKKFV